VKLGGNALQPAQTATTVRVRDGEKVAARDAARAGCCNRPEHVTDDRTARH
jgi:hypothetical protein